MQPEERTLEEAWWALRRGRFWRRLDTAIFYISIPVILSGFFFLGSRISVLIVLGAVMVERACYERWQYWKGERESFARLLESADTSNSK